jgi:pheromone shutdown protein TraB
MDPGLEFKVAMEEADKLRAHIVYGDADQQRTMQRISQSLSAKAGLLPTTKGSEQCNR